MFAMTSSLSTTLRVLFTFVLVAVLVAAMVGLVEFFRGLSSIGSGKQDKEISTEGVFLPEVSVDRMRSTVARLSSVGSRVTGYPGAKASADFLESEFLRLGMQDVHQEAFPVTVPMDKGASLRFLESGEEIPLRCVWPNLVRTPTTPGVRGRLIYAGDGEFSDFDGQDVSGNVVLMDFNSGGRWVNAGILGASAVVFIAPESTTSGEAEDKFAEVPVSMPRFYVDREAGERLRGLAGEGLEVEVKGRMDWEVREGYNVVGTFPGSDPDLRDQEVMLSAYYDGMSVVPSLAPAAEMACGIAGLLELGEMLRVHPPARTVLFLATSGHCQNLRGIDAYMQRHSRKKDEFKEDVIEPVFPKLFLGLDLSSGNDGITVWDSREGMGASGFTREKHFFGVSLGRRLSKIAEIVSTKMERDPEDMFANVIASMQSDKAFAKVISGRPLPIESEYALACGTPALSLITSYDARMGVDSPLDRIEGVNFDNLRTQLVFLGGMLTQVLNDKDALDDVINLDLTDTAWAIEGRVKAFSRNAIIPDIEMGGAVVALRSRRESKVHKGVRGDYIEVADETGKFSVTRLFREYEMEVHPFVLDSESGDIKFAPDRGGDIYPISARISRAITKPLLVLFRCVPTSFYETVDPRQLGRLSDIVVMDAGNSIPPHYGYFFETARPEYREEEPTIGVVFTEPGKRVKLTLSTGLFGVRFLLVNADPEGGDGAGFLTEGPAAFEQTAYKAALDMWRVDDGRIRELLSYGIENTRLTALHDKAEAHLREAEEALKERRWSGFIQNARAAQGTEARAYPDVKGTQNDVIHGVVFFMAMLIPCSFFAERLVFAFADIRKQIAGFFGFFFFVWFCLSVVHPAFSLANPALVLVAFLILALATFVLKLISSRFSAQMRALRTDAAVAHETDIGRGSAFYAAFVLGISNMRRRKLRTSLTLVTVLLLTFTVMSFTSLKFMLRHMRIPWTEGPFRAGAMIRDGAWKELDDSVLEYTSDEFRDIGRVVPRAWYTQATKIQGGGQTVEAASVVGMVPEERLITGIDSCLSSGRWLAGNAECVIPDSMAGDLGLTVEDVGRSTVRVFGRELKVVGIMDSERLKGLEDLDGAPLTPVDFGVVPEDVLAEQLQQGATSQRAAQQQSGRTAGSTVGIHVYKHLNPDRVVFLPYHMMREMGGTGNWWGGTGGLRSVAIGFDEGIDVGKVVERFVSRLELTVFGSIPQESGPSEVFVFSSHGMTSVSGLGILLIPIAIAALIVLNTMMGAVYERFRDIGVYSAVGLAPSHIGMLFMAESCVYAVIGAVGGYLVAQGVGRVLFESGLLQGLSLNYSSLSAVMAMGMVMSVVMLSTLYPSKKASQMAVPDVMRRWELSDPEGDHWRFEFPFTVSSRDVRGMFSFLTTYFRAYSRYSLGEFYADGVSFREEETPEGPSYTIQMQTWLAPFDMGVSQETVLRATPTGRYGIYEIETVLDRMSGELQAWVRTNRQFLTLLRKQFLIWRTLSDQVRDEYAKADSLKTAD